MVRLAVSRAAAPDLQRRQIASRQYQVNCSAAEPESFGQVIDPDQGRFEIRLHSQLCPSLCGLPSALLIRLT